MKIAIFGGSFDPVHIEHIHLVQAALAELRPDKLIVVPACKPPHKQGRILSANSDRLEMCRLAFSDIERVEVSDFEICSGGTSYTYLTCEYFRSVYPSAQLFWLVGTDMLRDFPTWKYPQRILENITLAVCARTEQDGWQAQAQADFYQRFRTNFVPIRYNGANVSSTKIRVLAGAGADLTCLTPAKVAAYIQKNALYEIAGAKAALALEKTSRREHSLRVACLAAARATQLKVNERQAIAAALFHDCAKNLPPNSPYLDGFEIKPEWGDVPDSVLHQYQGAYVAEKFFGVRDEDVLAAIRYHTSGRPNMCTLEKLIFLADMLEEERNYNGVELLRKLFWDKDGLDRCLTEALRQTLLFIKEKGARFYPLTQKAYDFYKNEKKGEYYDNE